ncbi:2-polyprenyl-6-methoxyphenol hydroxylase-like FAD-dependent oxidoreductase [Catenulispora sp. GAS73]|uniref:hypothetical protein n=1 Tax=Catenulispora sp. GAS73 TaxID=3156269 RepID=UPI003519CCF6
MHEAHAPTDRSGAMLTVAPNGLAALETVGLRAAVEAVGNPLHAMVMEKGNGRTLMRVPSLPDLPLSRVLYRAESKPGRAPKGTGPVLVRLVQNRSSLRSPSPQKAESPFGVPNPVGPS